MKVEALVDSYPHGVSGSQHEFLTRMGRWRRCRELEEQGYVVAKVLDGQASEPPSSASESDADAAPSPESGQLRDAIEGAVEVALALWGAPPPSVGPSSDLATIAEDQVVRARLADATGVCLVLPALEPISDDGVLEESDSAILAIWNHLSHSQPVKMLFDRGDHDVLVLSPMPLGKLVGAGVPIGLRSSAPPPPVVETTAAEEAPDTAASIEWPPLDDGSWEEELTEQDRTDPMPSCDHGLAVDTEVPPPPDEAEAGSDESFGDAPSEDDATEGAELFGDTEGEPLTETDDPSAADAGEAGIPSILCPAGCEEAAEVLTEAHGPQPVSTIEELFRTRYAPTLEALCAGVQSENAVDAVASWRSQFEKSYGDSFTTMRLTGKRPQMVLDAPNVAARIGRLNGARSVQLLLVDAWRYDLGQRTMQRFRERIGEDAVCVEQALLWSALPTITPTQLRLLSRGPRGLRDAGPPSERDAFVRRGRSVTTLRRLRIGHRDLVKLDVVEARLRDAGEAFVPRMEALADEVSQVLVRFVSALAPRTLLFVFGDHGFQISPESGKGRSRPAGTTPATHGGASPEEVLVPAYAWLLAGKH